MLQGLLVFLQLTQNGTHVQVSVSQGALVIQLDLDVQGTLQVLYGQLQLAHLAIIAGEVVHSDCLVLQTVVTEQFCLLEEVHAHFVLLLLQEDHGNQVTEFTEFLRTLLILF